MQARERPAQVGARRTVRCAARPRDRSERHVRGASAHRRAATAPRGGVGPRCLQKSRTFRAARRFARSPPSGHFSARLWSTVLRRTLRFVVFSLSCRVLRQVRRNRKGAALLPAAHYLGVGGPSNKHRTIYCTVCKFTCNSIKNKLTVIERRWGSARCI